METKEMLKSLRKSRNLSAQEVAEKCDISLGVYKAYESGQRNLGVPALCKIADFYGVSTDYLLGRIAEPPKSLVDIINNTNEFTEGEKLFILSYLSIDDNQRKNFVGLIKKFALSVSANNFAHNNEPDEESEHPGADTEQSATTEPIPEALKPFA